MATEMPSSKGKGTLPTVDDFYSIKFVKVKPRRNDNFWITELETPPTTGNHGFHDQSIRTNIISSRLWTIFKWLTIIGFFNISKQRPANKRHINRFGKLSANFNIGTYYIKLLSLRTIYPVIFPVIMALFSYISFKAEKLQNLNSNWVTTLSLISGAVQANLSALLPWFRLKSTPRLLNGWDELERQYLDTFETALDSPLLLKQLNFQVLYYVLLPEVIYVAFGTIRLTEWTPIGAFLWASLAILSSAVVVNQALYFIVCYVMKYILGSILGRIRTQLSTEIGNVCNITSHLIYKWKCLLLLSRSQLQVISDWLAPFGLLMNLIRIINLAASSYIVLALVTDNYTFNVNGAYENQVLKVKGHDLLLITHMAVITGSTSIYHLLLEIFYAGKIHQKNEEILDLLSDVDTSNMDVSTKFELQSLIDVLSRKPSKVTYGGALPADCRLILSVISSSISYLIILLQFKPTS